MKPKYSDGRTFACPECDNRRVCSSCRARIRYGKPNPNQRWDGLHMSEIDWKRLLVAAAEFDELADKYEDRPTVTEFVDWLRPDVCEDAA